MPVIAKIKSRLGNYAYNVPGWKTRRKILVFESDDWGSERTPDRETFDRLLKAGLSVDKCPFSKYDTIESNDDLAALYGVLGNHKDKNGNPAVITANFNVANPDYDKIRQDSFEKYHYINYAQTLGKYPGRENVPQLLVQGIEEKLLFPQYHSREHLCPAIWLDELRKGNKGLRVGFDHGVFGLSRATAPDIVRFHLASMLFGNEQEKAQIGASLKDGYNYFGTFFGFKPESFIAPVYTWNEVTEKQLSELDINFIQSSFYQNYFAPYQTATFEKRFMKMGAVNKLGQLYTVRNSVFEPSITPGRDNIGDCLQGIRAAFTMGAPAIVSTHRLNFTGGVEAANREKNLAMLNTLLGSVVRLWPDVEFMNSVELSKTIRNEKFS